MHGSNAGHQSPSALDTLRSLAIAVACALLVLSSASAATADCGDGTIDVGEACDDNNAISGDGCSGSCQVEAGWGCAGEPSTCLLISPVSVPASHDSFLLLSNPNRNEGANEVVLVKRAGKGRTVVSFDEYPRIDLPTVGSAKLVLTIDQNPGGWGAAGRTLEIHALLTGFTEGNGRSVRSSGVRTRGTGQGVTWRCATDNTIEDKVTDCDPTWGGGEIGPVLDSVLIFDSDTGEISFDVTEAVRNGTNSFLIKKADEDTNGRVFFVSREGAAARSDPSLAPRMDLDACQYTNDNAFEVCDGIDNDCDGTPDPTDAPVVTRWFADGDGDGFGDSARATESCARPLGDWSLLGTDCDDTDADRHPARAESCNGIDDDCNGAADFEIAPGDTEDDDRDGRADARCTPRPVTPDCDDRDAASSGDSPEVCDARDNDCDGRTDEGVESTSLYRDEDGDGYGSTRSGVVVGCGAVPGYSARDGDCDDGSSIRSPAALEGCNGVDDDCDSRVDEDPTASFCPADQTCLGGRCRPRPTCPEGYADCDGVRANGCESFLATDSLNCGVCGRRCPSEAGATSSCVASRCAPIACDSAYLDCNGNLGRGRDGCEHPASCGPCGTTASTEVCGNGLDDDCDGVLEEGCSCTAGMACTTTCGSDGMLACAPGGGASCSPPAEMCNGRDDDCDGLSDEGCCMPGTSCRTTCGSFGTTTCGPMGTPGTCTPPTETCNGRDDDCDTRTDESTAPPITCGRGVCQRSAPACDMGMPGVCTPGTPGIESCNALDDDCDGSSDEGFGAPVVCGVGICQRTVPGCPVGGMMMTCTPGMPGSEVCNGLDDDCDTHTDEGFGSVSCGDGACRRTVDECVGGVPQTCIPAPPSFEVCDGVDNDCDTRTDESLGNTTCGVGPCQRTTANCVAGLPQSCTPGMPGTEVCNAVDDDCDSTTDESLGSTTCGLGICTRTQPNCVAGAPNMCSPGAPMMELCNSVDEDCNGLADNGCPSSVGVGGSTAGPSFGTATGIFSGVSCAAGEVVVGLTGYSGTLVDRVSLTCQAITLAPDTLMSPDYGYPIEPTGLPYMTGFLGGTGGGGPNGGPCPYPMIAFGVFGGAGASVDQIGFHCAPAKLVRMGASWTLFLDFGMAVDTPPVGPMTGTFYDFACPPGEALVGLEGYTSSWLRQVTPRCAPITITTL